jgi:polyhydroxybutyrate depolymerase
VSILHIHGTDDRLVLYENADKGAWNFVSLLSVQATIAAWVATDGCPPTPNQSEWPDRDGDGHIVSKAAYGPGRDGTEVILLTVHGGGHTWPGSIGFGLVLGHTSRDFNANDVIWEFFQAHPRPRPGSQSAPKTP